MSQNVLIYIDSSTKPKRAGYSTAFWAAFSDRLSKDPFRSGLVYSQRMGCNRIFYMGLIDALLDCDYWIDKSSNIEIQGDCESVIDQLILTNSSFQPYKRSTSELNILHDQVLYLQKSFKEKKRVTISFSYISDESPKYKKIDSLAKSLNEILMNKNKKNWEIVWT